MCDSEFMDVARRFVANAPMPMTLVDLDGRYIEISPSVVVELAGTGLSRDQLIGRFMWDLDDKTIETFERLRAEGTIETERVVALPHGRSDTVRVQGTHWRNARGEPIAVLFTHHDVTAEVEAKAAHRNAESQMRAVIDNIPSQIALVDLEDRVAQLINANLVAASGGRLRKTQPFQISSGRMAEFTAVTAAAEAAGGVLETEGEIYDARRPECWARIKHIIFSDADGRRKLLWIADDITDLKQAAEGLKRAAAEAEAANRAKSEFLANMSHEIRTPLNGVMGVAGALAKTELSSAQNEMVSLIETSAKALETLLSDILDVARIEAGKLEIRPEPFDLAASVNACATLFDAAAQAKGLDLKVDIAPAALGTYLGDATRIRQIVSNLLGNAVKFTQHGEITLAVSAKASRTTSELSFEVRDTGIGFDAETGARLFSRFEQADGSITRRFGGSGLGLSISRSLTQAMGGRLEGNAEPGKGAVFTLTIDLPRCDEAADHRREEADAAVPALDPLVGMRVLLAEDHPTNRRVVELILSAAGVDLTCVENGLEAVEAFRSSAFDLILMDMQMPVMDGLTAIIEIRKLEAGSDAQPMPIHVLTANAMPEHVRASTASGADGHLSKPILAEALLARVAEVGLSRTAAREETSVGIGAASPTSAVG